VKRNTFIAILFVAAAPLGAQAPQAPANPMSSSLQRGFASVSDFIVRAAQEFPEDKFGFKATPDVRTFAQEIAHVIDAHFLYCSRARNEASPATSRLEGTVNEKAALVAKLTESVAYCKVAYETVTDAMLAEPFQVGNARGVRLAPLAGNVAHDNEHYGKIVTYLRLNGLVPPSSQRQ
jgi:uncharacterized damage-inducible protein DinB